MTSSGSRASVPLQTLSPVSVTPVGVPASENVAPFVTVRAVPNTGLAVSNASVPPSTEVFATAKIDEASVSVPLPVLRKRPAVPFSLVKFCVMRAS